MQSKRNQDQSHTGATPVQRLLLDCTCTYRNPELRTGIQRVVRNIVACAPKVASRLGVSWESVLLQHHEWQPVRWQLPHDPSARASAGEIIRRKIRKIGKPVATRLRKIFVHRSIAHRFNQWRADRSRTDPLPPVAFGPGDVLLLLDAYWMHPTLDLSAIRAQGATVGLVTYDLIPIHYPQFCPPKAVAHFAQRLHALIPQVDFFVGISRTVGRDIQQYVGEHFPQLSHPPEAFSWFALGSRLDMCHPAGIVRPALRKAFAGPAPYLSVCTLSPHKNHAAILDAFDQCWARFPQMRLCLAGKQGWMANDLVARIRRHPRFGRDLFWFEGLSDTELDYCYRHSKAFIFASFAEGFGLPIAEALQHRLPVLASDIPVHREVGRDFCAFFDPHRPESLAALIAEFEHRAGFPGVREPTRYRATDWTTSTTQLFEKCLAHAARRARGRSGSAAGRDAAVAGPECIAAPYSQDGSPAAANKAA